MDRIHNTFCNRKPIHSRQFQFHQTTAFELVYNNLNEGQKIDSLISEYYFIYQDYRINNLYI
jgi:hypothetical protein